MDAERSRSGAHAARVERYYDYIYHWTQLTNRFRAFAAPASYAIHRGLHDPDTGCFGTDVVHDLIASKLARRAWLVGLDAGCGYGGTAIELQKRLGGTWQGITISRRQVDVAKRNLERIGLADSITVSLASFDEPLEQSFDVVVGIESLVHSERPEHTIDNLVCALKPGGIFIIVDDMPVAQVPQRLRADLDGFKRTWKCPVMPAGSQWCTHLEDAGCEIVGVEDLTTMMRPRLEVEIEAALNDVARRRVWRDRLGLSLVSDAQEGGLLLERLAREGAVTYSMITARKRLHARTVRCP